MQVKNTICEIDKESYTQEVIALAKRFESTQKDLENWIDERPLSKTFIPDLNLSVDGLWSSYQKTSSIDSHYLTTYGRVFMYDTSLAFYSQIVRDIRKNDFSASRRVASLIVKLLQKEEKKGGVALLHFSYNTVNDCFIDPYIITGTNVWIFKALFAYMYHSNDTQNLNELVYDVVKYLFPLQNIDIKSPAFGLISAGYKHNDKTLSYGYDIYRNTTPAKVLTRPVPLVVIDHNAAFADLLRLMALVIEKYPLQPELKEELSLRHSLVMKGLARTAEQSENSITWPAGICLDEHNGINRARISDHYSWGAATFLGINEEISWKSLCVLKNEFITEIDSIEIKDGEQLVIKMFPDDLKAKGIPYFSVVNKESYINMSDQDWSKFKHLIQPDATSSAIIFLHAFAQATQDDRKRLTALQLIEDLVTGLGRIHHVFKLIHNGRQVGMPYATQNILNYFNSLPSMAASAQFFIALEILQTNYPYFLGVPVADSLDQPLTEHLHYELKI